MTPTLTLHADLTLVEAGWTQAQLVELPAVITAAPTREAAIDALVDATQECLLAQAPAPTSRGEGIPLTFRVVCAPRRSACS